MIDLDQSVFMTTYTGRKFYIFNPCAEDVDIQDIAHALGMLCRFTGHCQRFYSVAEHCFHASFKVSPEYALEALLHDASEAYINDLSSPLKHHPQLAGYVQAEQAIEKVIAERFRVVYPMSPAVRDVDRRLVCTEAKQLLTRTDWTEGHPAYDDLRLWNLDPREATARYLTRFSQLIK